MISPPKSTGNLLIKTALTALLLALAACGAAQDERPSLAKRNAPQADMGKSKLTAADLSAAISKLDRAVRKVCGVPGQSPRTHLGSGASGAMREQIVLEFDRLFELARPHFKFTPRKTSFDPAMLTIKKGRPARAKLEKLIAWQFVGKVGPLAANLTPTLTLDEFGEAVGLFYARIADLTHTPSSKWSPYMNEGPHAGAPVGTPKSRTPDNKL